MALSFECERCGAAGSVRAEPGTPTLVKCSGCGNTFITGGPLGAPKIPGGVRAPAVPIVTPKAPPGARTATPPAAPAARPPTPPPRPPPPSRAVPPLDAPTGPDRWAKTEIDPSAVPPPEGGYVDFTLDDDPPVPPAAAPASAHATPVGRATTRAVPIDTPAPFPRREPTRELPRPERTPPPVAVPERGTGEPRPPAFASVTPPPPNRKWVPFAAVGGVGLALGAIVAVIATREPVRAPGAVEARPPVAAAAPTAPAPTEAPAETAEPPDPEPAAAPAAVPSGPVATTTPAPSKPVSGKPAAAPPEDAPERAAPKVRPPERRAPPPDRVERPERTERVATRRSPAATEPNPVPVPAASPPATAAVTSAAVTTAAFSPPPEASAEPAVEDAPIYPTDGFRRPVAADPGCVQRSLRLPRDLQDRVPETVPVRFAVGPDGVLSQFSLIAEVPDRRIGESIWAAIRDCKFKPGADARGRPVRLWVVMPIRFVGR